MGTALTGPGRTEGKGQKEALADVGAAAAASPLRRSPLDCWHRDNGARMVAFGGWEMPLEFDKGTLAEHMSCRRHAAIFDVSHLGTVRLVGSSAEAVLQQALTNNLAKISPGGPSTPTCSMRMAGCSTT